MTDWCDKNGVPFQLTPSRRATQVEGFYYHEITISTHALTEGDHPKDYEEPEDEISTHALTEGDASTLRGKPMRLTFQLTPSRRATANLDKFFF